MNTPQPEHRTTIWTAVAVTLLTLLGLALRLWHLGDTSFWLDEGASVQFASMPVREWLHFLWHGEANMLPYYLLLRVWLCFGHSETSVRLLSVLFGAATVPVVYSVASRCSGKLGGTIAAVLLALHSFHVSYSQEARSYSMVIFLLSVSWLALAQLVERDRERQRWVYLLTAGLAIYAHFFAGIVVVSQWISLYCFAPREAVAKLRKVQWMTAAVATPAILYGISHHSSLKWIPPVSYGGVLYSLLVFCGNSARLVFAFEVIVAFATGLAVIVVARNGRSLSAWNVAAPVCWLLFTPGLLLLISMIKPVLVTRYLSLAVPALAIVAAMALVKLKPLGASALAIVLSVMLLQATLKSQHLDQPNEDWHSAARYLTAHSVAGDGAVFLPDIGRAPFLWYWKEERPKQQILYPGRGPAFTWPAAHQPPETALKAVEATPPPRIWSVLAISDLDPTVAQFHKGLSSTYAYSCEHRVQEIRIVLYSKTRTDCPVD